MSRCFAVALIALSACAHTPVPRRTPGPMTGVQLPEDLIAVPGTSWIVVSNQNKDGAPGWLSVVDGHVPEIPPRKVFPTQSVSAEANGTAPAQRSPSQCPGPPDAAVFSPHGIALDQGDLYVVNHGGREAIEIFTLDVTQSPKAMWRDCIIAPPKVFGNGVDVLADGRVLLTSMGVNDGGVLAWDGRAWSNFTPQRLAVANGIASSTTHVFVSAWAERKVWRFAIDGSAPVAVALDVLPDNIRWTPWGTLLVAGQRATVEQFQRCTTKHTPCPPAFDVVEIDPRSLAVTQRISSNNDAFGAGSVAIVVGEQIWVGSFVTDSIAGYRGVALAEQLDKILEGAVDDKRIAGGVLVVMRDGAIVYQRAIGKNDDGTPTQEDTVVRLGADRIGTASAIASSLDNARATNPVTERITSGEWLIDRDSRQTVVLVVNGALDADTIITQVTAATR